MCGLAGYFTADAGVSAQVLTAMADSIRHRGPDNEGIWLDEAAGIGFAFRRLSIQDLSPAGHQPMASASGRFVIMFNGEIYNHLELRRELSDQAWRGHSDTETLLAACEAWGFEATLKKATGMFAIALWDRRERTLTLARDRFGEKPLYYGWQGKTFLFGSELKALRAHPAFCNEIDRNAIALQMRYCYVPAPYSIYQGIGKLLPGTFFTLDLCEPGTAPQQQATPKPYWQLADAVRAGQTDPFRGTDAEAVDELERVLSKAVRGQMISDVPLGAFLSGGVDSSLIVALMQVQSSRPVRTFTIGFDAADYNEAEHAKAVARHLGTDHTELYVTPEQAQAVIPQLPTLYDEPFGDSSQIPTFLIAQMARQHVTVALSGDGGDELFGGYNRHFTATAIWRRLGWVPAGLRAALGAGISGVAPPTWDRLYQALHSLLPKRFHTQRVGDKAHKLARMLASPDAQAVYGHLIAQWANTQTLVPDAAEPLTLARDPAQWRVASTLEERMMYLDGITYLPDDILTKVDRATMGVSLEGRMPFLDHRVAELAWRLPLAMKIRGNQGKWALRQVLYRHVPRELIERPKMGFGVPIDSWLRGPLRPWAEALLEPGRLQREGVFDARLVSQTWREHQTGARNWQHPLWNVLMFQAWREQKA